MGKRKRSPKAKAQETKKGPGKDISNIAESMSSAGKDGCECNWDIAVCAVDDLMEWVTELCKENHRMKEELRRLNQQ